MSELTILQDANRAIAEFIRAAREPGQSGLVPGALESLGLLYRELERVGTLIRQNAFQSAEPLVEREIDAYRANMECLQTELTRLELTYVARRIQLWQQQHQLAVAGTWAQRSRQQISCSSSRARIP